MLLHRRFIRLQALQNLYAFYIAQRANHEGALDQLRAAFQPTIFIDALATPEARSLAKEQALELFKAKVAGTQPPLDSPLPQVSQAVAQAQAHYNKAQAKDWNQLKKGLDRTAQKIDQAGIRIVQLLVEWANLGTKQAEKPQYLLSKPDDALEGGLHQNVVLQYLQSNEAWAQHVKKHEADWTQHLHIVAQWYRRFVKKHPQAQKFLAPSTNSYKAIRLLEHLVKKIIFKEEAIQDFFSDCDVSWTVHQHIVKKLVHRVLQVLSTHSKKSINLEKLSITADWEEAQAFYLDLINTAWEKDQELEALIVEKVQNWTADRLVLLDKIILKLALCEMKYFEHIPTKVSINEYIDLSKNYSTPKSSRFVNGLLDAMATTVR